MACIIKIRAISSSTEGLRITLSERIAAQTIFKLCKSDCLLHPVAEDERYVSRTGYAGPKDNAGEK